MQLTLLSYPLPRPAVTGILVAGENAVTDEKLAKAARDVLDYWFGEGPATTVRALEAKMLRWFGNDEECAEVKRRYPALITAADRGGLHDWTDTPRGKLALIIVLDQLMRMYYGMDDGRAFAHEKRAAATSLAIFDAGVPDDWSPEEHFVALLPLGHAEDLDLQHRAALEAQKIVSRASQNLRPMLETITTQLIQFMRVIKQFGRFPHRNQALGRESSPEELEFLATWKIRHPVRAYANELNTAEELERKRPSPKDYVD